MYADFAFYRDTYKGAAVDEDAFVALERQASLFIDRITLNRLNTGWRVTDAVKMAVCAVVDVLKEHEDARQEALTAAGVKSENTDGYSISYQNADDIRAAVESAMLEAAQPYLIYTGLMDRSIGGCCRC
jgi:hypothetical protein